MTATFQIGSDPSLRVETTIITPADKSISHRAIILSSLATGKTKIENFLTAEDCLHTADIFSKMGVRISRTDSTVQVEGVGLHGLKEPKSVLDVGNSGTGMRLILGVLAGQTFKADIDGDASIRTRPMRRVTDPLEQMGAKVLMPGLMENSWIMPNKTDTIHAPLRIRGSHPLKGINYTMPVASAQIKSAILLAGLYADGPASVTDPGVSRDHTERMMSQFGLPINVSGNIATITPVKSYTSPGHIFVPSDISSAAFWLVLGLILPNATIRIPHVGLNPTRTGILDAIKMMGGNVAIENEQQREGEPVGDLVVRSSTLTATTIEGAIIPRLIDEIPILAVAAAYAKGTTIIKDAQELRVKESDRIQTTADMLSAFGVQVEVLPDGLRIEGGGALHTGTVKSQGDHRIAMAASILSLAVGGESRIIDVDCIATSYPGFTDEVLKIAKEGLVQ